jgi:hypothetical protein
MLNTAGHAPLRAAAADGDGDGDGDEDNHGIENRALHSAQRCSSVSLSFLDMTPPPPPHLSQGL